VVANQSPSTQSYWDSAAETYDRDFEGTLIGQLRREAVWREMEQTFRPAQRVLELNCGTGLDAVHLAERGVHIVACDIAPRMIDLANQRVSTTNFRTAIDFRVLPTEDIGTLTSEGPFDGAFSNFSGLNCVEDLGSVAKDLSRLLKHGAPVLVCMMGRFVPWEIAWFLAHRNPRRAVRRLGKSIVRQVEGCMIRVRFLSVKEIARAFAPEFRLRKWSAIGICVPPSYMEHWARRFPGVTRALAGVDSRIGSLPFFRSIGDCVLLNLERTAT
jgi:ubiquinone/menaquinone biosynthesis C-methylase UbiE